MAHQERSNETRLLLIEAASKRLWFEDEGELRIADICQDTGLSSSAIYSNFRSRQGLVDAAYLDMYAHLSREYFQLVARIAGLAETKTSITDALTVEGPPDQTHHAPRESRRMRLRIATAALSRPTLREKFIEVQEAHLAEFGGMIEGLQSRGVIGSSLNGRQLAVLLEAFSFGRALDDISLHPETNETWNAMLLKVLSSA